MSDYDTVVRRVRDQLASRGARSISGMSRVFRQLDSFDGNKRVDPEEMCTGLTEAGVEVTKEEVALLIAKWDEDCSGDINFDEFLKGLRGVLSEPRQAVVDAAWAKFDVDGSGTINIDDLKGGGYNCSQHPKFISGEMTEDDIFGEFLGAFGDKDGDGSISKEEWYDYYRGISSSFDTDEQFVQSITNAWQL